MTACLMLLGQDGVWQRWRMLFTGVYKFVDLTIVTTDGKPAPCTMGLVAKVNHYPYACVCIKLHISDRG
jgi:hypothetical protein